MKTHKNAYKIGSLSSRTLRPGKRRSSKNKSKSATRSM